MQIILKQALQFFLPENYLDLRAFKLEFTRLFMSNSFILNTSMKFPKRLRKTYAKFEKKHWKERKDNLFGNKQFSIVICKKFWVGYIFSCKNPFTFVLSCVRIQVIKGSSRETEQQVKSLVPDIH